MYFAPISLCILTLLGCAWFCLTLWHRHGTLLQLGIGFAVGLAISYPVRLLTVIAWPDDPTVWYRGILEPTATLDTAIWQAVGMFSFFLGYLATDQSTRSFLVLQNHFRRSSGFEWAILISLFSASLLGKGIKIVTGNYISFVAGENVDQRFANLIENVHMLGWVALAGACCLILEKRCRDLRHRILVGTILLVEVGYQLVQGSKTFLSLPLFIVVLAVYLVRKKLPVKLGVALVLWYALIVFPFVSRFRDVFGSDYGGVIPTASSLRVRSILTEGTAEVVGGESTFESNVLRPMARFAGADELYHMRDLVPAVIPYGMGRDYLGIAYGLIPRLFWPGKPIVSPAAAFGDVSGTITSVSTFPVAEMYFNLGAFGIWLGMAVWGICLTLFMRLLDRVARSPMLHTYAQWIFLAEFYWLVTPESQLSTILASVPKKVLLYWLVIAASRVLSTILFGQSASNNSQRRVCEPKPT